MKDAIDRRLRTKAQPSKTCFVRQERDNQIVLALKRHKGPLPASLIHPFWKGDSQGSLHTLQKRLTPMFHGTVGMDPLIVRPNALNPMYGPKCNASWYDLSENGLALARGMDQRPYRAPKRDNFHHRAMGACISASFEQEAPQHGLRFIELEEILAHPKCPAHTKASPSPLLIPLFKGKLEPDDLFGLEYESAFRFFFREDDRGTESINRKDDLQNSIKDKLEKYENLFSSKAYQEHFGFTNASVIFFTTIPGRVESMKAEVKGSRYADRFLFKVMPMFGIHEWRAPKAPLDVFSPYITGNGHRDLTQP